MNFENMVGFYMASIQDKRDKIDISTTEGLIKRTTYDGVLMGARDCLSLYKDALEIEKGMNQKQSKKKNK